MDIDTLWIYPGYDIYIYILYVYNMVISHYNILMDINVGY